MDDPRSGHLGPNKTLELLARKFHWEGMAESVREYVGTCPACQGARRPRHRPYGKLQSLPLPEGPWQEISLDFITGLPSSYRDDGKVYDAILVIVDRFTKMALFIPTYKTLTAAELARILYEQVECHFGTPLGIVSDRDHLLTSKFWAEWCVVRETQRRLSTAYHPQTDGQTERTHQMLEKWLRTCCDSQHWASHLHEAEFAYNNRRHNTIGVSPFEALYGFHPRMTEFIPGRQSPKVQGVIERLRKTAAIRQEMQRHWEQAVQTQQEWYNRRHQEMHFEAGQIVGLSTKTLRFKESKKVHPTYIRVRILRKVGQQAYQVKLPDKYSRVHDVFPVSSLEPWRDRDGKQPEKDLPDLEDELEEWEVEDIVGSRRDRGRQEYLVKWKDWPVEYNSWEPEEHLENAQTLLKRFQRRKTHRKWDDRKEE